MPKLNLSRELMIGLRVTLAAAAMCIVYTLVVTGISQLAFHDNANGGLITRNGQVVGAQLIGQSFLKQSKDQNGKPVFSIDPRFFQGRLSYTVDASSGQPAPYNAANSVGSNYGPSNPLLLKAAQAAVAAYRAQGVTGAIPIDLVTGDFTGFDPDISEASALVQVPMVARARGLDPAKLSGLVESQLQGRILWIFGEPHVNVLQLNLALEDGGGR
jgi:potassium-transporting ATPase KdpC subunit